MLVPLGLGTKIFKVPWTTIGLSLAILYSFFSIQKENLSHLKLHSYKDTGVIESDEKMYFEFCLQESYQNKMYQYDCEKSALQYVHQKYLFQFDERPIDNSHGQHYDMILAAAYQRFLTSDIARNLYTYNEYQKNLSQFQNLYLHDIEKQGYYTLENGSWFSLMVNSLFSENVIMLIFSLTIFISFGSYVELKMGSIPYLLISLSLSPIFLYYMVDFSELSVDQLPVFSLSYVNYFILAFYTDAFFKHYSRFTLLPMIQSKILVKNRWATPMIFTFLLINHIIWSEKVLLELVLMSSCLGLVFSALYSRFSSYQWPFIFKEEYQLVKNSKALKDPFDRILRINRAWSINPMNDIIRKMLLEDLSYYQNHNIFESSMRKIFIKVVEKSAGASFYYGDSNWGLGVLAMIPVLERPDDYLKTFKMVELLKIAKQSANKHHYLLALKIWDYLLQKDIKESQAVKIQNLICETLNMLIEQKKMSKDIENYCQQTGDEYLLQIYRQLTSGKQLAA